jgi:hypothetical protein
MKRQKMMQRNKVNYFSLFLFLIFCFSVSPANTVLASRTESVTTCLGTYTYAYDVVKKDQLIDMVITRDNETGNVVSVIADIHLIPTYQAQHSITESNTELLAKQTDQSNSKIVLRYTKANNHLLFVANHSNGNTNKFEGTCF